MLKNGLILKPKEEHLVSHSLLLSLCCEKKTGRD